MTIVIIGSLHGVSVLHLRCLCILTDKVCGGTNVETGWAASPWTTKHQVTPLWTCGLEDCHVMLLVLKHKLGHVVLLYSPFTYSFEYGDVWGSAAIFSCTNWKSVVTRRPICTWWNKSWYLLDKKMDAPRGSQQRRESQKDIFNFLLCSWIQFTSLHLPFLVIILVETTYSRTLAKVYVVVCSIEVFRTIIHMPFSSSSRELRVPSSLP
jgi:hypothetical protein